MLRLLLLKLYQFIKKYAISCEKNRKFIEIEKL